MDLMAKKKPPEPPTPEPKPDDEKGEDGGKRYPSRENTRYVGIPLNIHQALEKYAKDHSSEDDEKSISWAARVLLKKALAAEKRWPHKPPPDSTP